MLRVQIQTDADVKWLSEQLGTQWQRPRRLWRRALAAALAQLAKTARAHAAHVPPGSHRSRHRGGKVSTLQQVVALSGRQWANYTRNPGNACARMLVGMVLGLLVGGAYWNLDLWTDVLGVLWFSISILALIPFCSIALFATDRRFFLVETADGLYSAFAFWASWAAAETTLNTVTALMFGMPMHFMVDLAVGRNSLWQMQGVFIVVYLVAAQLLVVLAVVMPNQVCARCEFELGYEQ